MLFIILGLHSYWMEQCQNIEAVYHPEVDPLIVGAITGNRLLRYTVAFIKGAGHKSDWTIRTHISSGFHVKFGFVICVK